MRVHTFQIILITVLSVTIGSLLSPAFTACRQIIGLDSSLESSSNKKEPASSGNGWVKHLDSTGVRTEVGDVWSFDDGDPYKYVTYHEILDISGEHLLYKDPCYPGSDGYSSSIYNFRSIRDKVEDAEVKCN